MDLSWSIMTSAMGYVSLTGWGLANFLGSKKQGLKTADWKLNFQIAVYAFK